MNDDMLQAPEAARDGDEVVVVEGFTVRVDVGYASGHLWVALQPGSGGAIRFGLDPLGVETTGTVAHLVVAPPGTTVRRGAPLGSVEAEKFVGPLAAPISGVVQAVNPDLATPRRVAEDPYGTWIAEIVPAAWDEEVRQLVRGRDDVVAWFAEEVRRFRLDGVLAE